MEMGVGGTPNAETTTASKRRRILFSTRLTVCQASGTCSPKSCNGADTFLMPARHEVARSQNETMQNKNMKIQMLTLFGVSPNTFRTFYIGQVPLVGMQCWN